MSTLGNDRMRPWLGEALVQVVRSAERVGLFVELEAAATPAQLAKRLDLSERALALALPVLSTLGCLEQVGDAYRRRADVRSEHEPWPHLEAFIRTGEVPDDIDRPERRGAYYRKSVVGLANMFENDARQLAEQLGPAARILDVGAGGAMWSLAMAERHPATHVIAVDRPEVVASAKKVAELMKLDDRITVVAGDYFEATVDEPVDRIVMANVLHLEDADDAARLIRRYADMLHEDGELVIVDIFGGRDLPTELFSKAYDLHLGMRTRIGRAHREAELRRMCAEAGLGNNRFVRLGSFALGALVCGRGEIQTRERDKTTVAVADLDALRAERDLYRARFEMAFDGSADAIVAVDKNGECIVTMNTAFISLLGVEWTALEVHDLDEVVAPHDLQRCRHILVGLATGEITERRHHITMLRDGVPFAAEITAYDPMARSVICLVVRDRDRLAREEKLQALGELVGGLMHDLNTPLANIKSNCELAQTIAQRLSAVSDERQVAALHTATADALRALADISAKLGSIEAFATLEGAALEALAPHFKTGLAHAICERMGDTAGE